MFGRLIQDYELKEIVCNMPNKLSGTHSDLYHLIDFIERTGEQEAINIMKELEKEIED